LSCNSDIIIRDNPPPYVITKPLCIAGKSEGYYNFAGVEFEFLNVSDKNISKFNVSFIVYDADTQKNPLAGSNIINVGFEGEIEPDKIRKYIISLDSYLYTVPEKPFIIDHFYVAEIYYSDGSNWKDISGVYFVNGITGGE
jgi:hypothetical protein